MDTFTSYLDVGFMSRKSTNKSLSIAFGAVARSFRKQAGFSQEGFAHEAGFDRSFWGAIERGRYCPSLGTVWSVAEALGTTPSAILVEVEKTILEEQGQGKETTANSEKK